MTVPQGSVFEKARRTGPLGIRKAAGGLKSLPFRRPAVIGGRMRDPTKSWSRPRRAGDEQGSGGALHQIGSNPSDDAKNRSNKHYCDPSNLPPTSVPDAFERSRILPRANQVSTGHLIAPVCALVPPFRIPHPRQQKTAIRMDGGFRWQRMRDSNPRERSQSPVCYRYTNPLSAW